MFQKAEKNPCYGCGDRKVGCHGGCERYAEYKAMITELKEKEIKGRRRDYPDKPIRRSVRK